MSGEDKTNSALTTRPPMDTSVCEALRAPVEKIVKRKLPFVGSNGPSCNVSLSRITPGPLPSPLFVNTPGATRSVGTVPLEVKPSELVIETSAVPISVWAGTRKLTCPGDTKKICAARPLIVTVVPPTFVGNVPLGNFCDCWVEFARAPPVATAMLSGATALVVEGSLPNDAAF